MAATNSTIKTHSPLESLVRRASARKPDLSVFPAQVSLVLGREADQQPPASPLIHSHFARHSTATASSNDSNSYLGSSRTSFESRDNYQDPVLEHRYYDGTVCSTVTRPALRDSWQSTLSSQTAPKGTCAFDAPGAKLPQRRTNYNEHQLPLTSVPTLIVSSPTEPQINSSVSNRVRRPVEEPVAKNFSRPVRPAVVSTPENEESKRRVIERNSRYADPSTSFLHPREQMAASFLGTKDQSLSPITQIRSPAKAKAHLPTVQSPSSVQQVSTSKMHFNPIAESGDTLSRPPSRSNSLNSLYSTYSYYDVDAIAPNYIPLDTYSSSLPPTSRSRSVHSPLSTPSLRQATAAESSSQLAPSIALDYLQLGIQHHESNRLKDSAICFEKSAKEGGGCGLGMLMWGLSLRHGWGCEKNEKVGFRWLRRAAESAVEDLEHARTGGSVEPAAVQTELVLAIYEVGQCFFQGWGVTKDQKMAVSYYTVAARLGDADAQNDLAFCLVNGKGCKKDRKEAAKWYRAAVAQGQSDIGLAWIYKEKFQ